jgi:hypothetical protein
MSMLDEMTQLWTSVRDPEYLHLLLESLPLYGLGLGLVFLTVAHFAGEAKSRMMALMMITLSCASVWPYQELRKQATPRIVATRDISLGPLIRQQTERRERHDWAYLVVAALGAATMAAQVAGKGKGLLLLLIPACMALFWFSVWMHKKECEVYHRNIIKYRPPR